MSNYDCDDEKLYQDKIRMKNMYEFAKSLDLVDLDEYGNLVIPLNSREICKMINGKLEEIQYAPKEKENKYRLPYMRPISSEKVQETKIKFNEEKILDEWLPFYNSYQTSDFYKNRNDNWFNFTDTIIPQKRDMAQKFCRCIHHNLVENLFKNRSTNPYGKCISSIARATASEQINNGQELKENQAALIKKLQLQLSTLSITGQCSAHTNYDQMDTIDLYTAAKNRKDFKFGNGANAESNMLPSFNEFLHHQEIYRKPLLMELKRRQNEGRNFPKNLCLNCFEKQCVMIPCVYV